MDKSVIGQHLQWFRTWPSDLMYILASRDIKEAVDADVAMYFSEIPYRKCGIGALNYCLLYRKPFRNVYNYRMQGSTVLRHFARLLIKPLDTIELYGIFGPGLRIYHNFCVLGVYKAGRNLVVKPGVVIGRGNVPAGASRQEAFPTIGDNVTIYANALIFGGITIGDNAVIGGGAVIGRDVPADSLAYGSPMAIRPVRAADRGDRSLT